MPVQGRETVIYQPEGGEIREIRDRYLFDSRPRLAELMRTLVWRQLALNASNSASRYPSTLLHE
jgi:hypothetical protein